MNQIKQKDYLRIEQAIEYINANFKEQPSLEKIAESVNLSQFHFQRMFTEWAGVSPKKFMQYLSVEYAKGLLESDSNSLANVAFETGLSGTSRLHDLFVSIEGMTPGQYKRGGSNLKICYEFYQTPFGQVLIASTDRGVCHLAFEYDQELAVEKLHGRFENALFERVKHDFHLSAVAIFNKDWSSLDSIKLHLSGSEFQLKVWQSLLTIPFASLSSYGDIANKIGQPNASRAVGSAIGSNPIAYLIPCHRVIQRTGKVGGYMWGSSRKSAMIAWEAAAIATN